MPGYFVAAGNVTLHPVGQAVQRSNVIVTVKMFRTFNMR